MVRVRASVFMPAVLKSFHGDSSSKPGENTSFSTLSRLSEDDIHRKNLESAQAIGREYEHYGKASTSIPEVECVLDYRTSQDELKVLEAMEEGRLPRNYSRKTNRELKDILISRSMPHSYRKDTQIAKLNRSDMEKQYEKPPKILLTFHYTGFPLQKLPTELRDWVYTELLAVETDQSSVDFKRDISRALQIRQGLPREAFHRIRELNRYRCQIFDFGAVEAGRRTISLNEVGINHSRKSKTLYNPWLRMPIIVRECCHLDVELCVSEMEQTDAATYLALGLENWRVQSMITVLKTLVSIVLLPNPNLKSVRLLLNIYPRNAVIPANAIARWKEVEKLCSLALLGLRGLDFQGSNAVHFEGFRFIEKDHLREVKEVISQPRPLPNVLRNLSTFSRYAITQTSPPRDQLTFVKGASRPKRGATKSRSPPAKRAKTGVEKTKEDEERTARRVRREGLRE